MSWTLEKDFRFEAAHRLPHHDGKCQRLHGHSFKGKLICEGEQLHRSGSNTNMLLDFSEMKKAISELVENRLDHFYLNESLSIESPTSEAIAKWIFDTVKPRLPQLIAVEIEETCTSRCRYEPRRAP